MRKLLITGLMIFTILNLSACQSKNSEKEIRIAKQFGLAYAPIEILEQQHLLEDEGYNVTYVKASNTANIRELMLANQLDVGFMAIPPFLIGYDNKMEWKIFGGLSSVRVGLATYKDYDSISDIQADDKIALPQPGSIQHILLAMACEKEFNDATRFDSQLVSLSHADGYTALLAKSDVTLHFTSEPYLSKEIENGNHLILDGNDVMGSDFTFVVGTTTDIFYENTVAYNDFIEAYNESIDYINNNLEAASTYLATVYDISYDEMYEYLSSGNISYSTEIKGFEKFYDFMSRTGYLNSEINLKDAVVSDVVYE